MRRIATLLIGIALVAFYFACSADSPAPTQGGGSGSGSRTPTSTALQVRLFTNNANPVAGSCSLIQAIVSLNGANVPEGTGVAFSTDNGFFEQNGLGFVSVTTQGGAAVTAICNLNPGLSNVKASATVGGQTGTASIPISFQPSTQAGPFFSSCAPGLGPNTGGTTLVLNGGRFTGSTTTTRVTFTAAGVTREALVTSVTPTAITVVTPAFPEAISPTVPVTITVTMGSTVLTIPNCFVYGSQPAGTPSVTAVLPSSGTNDGGTQVSIIGSGFSVPLQVFFGPVEAQVLSVSFNQIVAISPRASLGNPNQSSTAPIRVHEVNSNVDSGTSVSFTYTPQIQIFSFSGFNIQPFNGPFSPVTIDGQGFHAPVKVSLAGFVATVISVSATEIIVQPGDALPTNCTDISGSMSVTNIDTGDSATGQSFTYLVKSAGPFISGVNTSGTTVTITGGNLALVSSVTIGGKSGNVLAQNNTTIVATVPAFAAPACPTGVSGGSPVSVGDVTVTTTFGCTATATGAFTAPCVAPTPAPTPGP